MRAATEGVVIPKRRDVAMAARARGQLIAAVLPIHYPRELLRACGFHPMELWGPPGTAWTSGSHRFQPYACAVVRHAMAFVERGGIEVADVVLVPHACDALQGMGSVLRDYARPRQQVLTFQLPRVDRPSGRAYLRDELHRLAEELAACSGRPARPDALLAELEWEEKADDATAELVGWQDVFAVPEATRFAVARTREYLPPNEFIDLAQTLPRTKDRPQGRVPLFLSGIVPEPMSMFTELTRMGVRVVGDDLACLSRRIYGHTGEEDPVERLVQRLLQAPPDPTRGSSIASRVEYLTHRLEESGARGMLIYDLKFCEPELFDVPLLRKHLTQRGYGVAHVEVELEGRMSQQTLTRIDAFVETLR